MKVASTAKGTTASTAMMIRAQEQAVRAALTHRQSLASLIAAKVGLRNTTVGATAAVANMSRAVATGSAVMSRALAVIAPLAGVAVAGLLLIPGAMDAIGLGADNMENKVSASLARAGVAFDSFGEKVRQTASQAEMARLINDMETLSAASGDLSGIGKGNFGGAFSAVFGLKEYDSLLFAVGELRGMTGEVENAMVNVARRFSGQEVLDLSKLTGGASAAAQDIFMDILYRFCRTGIQSRYQ